MEEVVLLSAAGEPLGAAPKAQVHHEHTPLHLAFSLHLVDASGRLLLTRRSMEKLAWPGVWTNSCCGHPGPGEPIEDAVRRRAKHELGVDIGTPLLVLEDFSYRAVDARGTVENEVCPVFIARLESDVAPRLDEVEEWAVAGIEEALDTATALPFLFSPWFVLQAGEPRLRRALLSLAAPVPSVPAVGDLSA